MIWHRINIVNSKGANKRETIKLYYLLYPFQIQGTRRHKMLSLLVVYAIAAIITSSFKGPLVYFTSNYFEIGNAEIS